MIVEYFISYGIFGVLCAPEVAVGIKTVALEVIAQPASTGPVCPGQEIILTCNVTQTGTVQELYLNWQLQSVQSLYDIINPQSGPQTLGDFVTTAVFMIATDKRMIISNATLQSAVLSNNNSVVSCKSPPQDNVQTVTITVTGIQFLPFTMKLILLLM